jgi:hypothetical protein
MPRRAARVVTPRRAVNAPLYPVDQRVLKEARKPRPHGRALYGVVQLREDAQDAAHDPGNGGWVSDKLWSVADLAEMIDAAQPKPGKRGPYKAREVIS